MSCCCTCVVLRLCPGVGLSWHCGLPPMHEVTIRLQWFQLLCVIEIVPSAVTWLNISMSFPVWWFDSPRVLMAPKASLIGKLPDQQIQVLQRKRAIQTKRQSSKLAPHNRVSHNKKKRDKKLKRETTHYKILRSNKYPNFIQQSHDIDTIMFHWYDLLVSFLVLWGWQSW